MRVCKMRANNAIVPTLHVIRHGIKIEPALLKTRAYHSLKQRIFVLDLCVNGIAPS